jgi:hypothetical protein
VSECVCVCVCVCSVRVYVCLCIDTYETVRPILEVVEAVDLPVWQHGVGDGRLAAKQDLYLRRREEREKTWRHHLCQKRPSIGVTET